MFEQEALHFIYPTNYGSTHVEELEQCVFLEKKVIHPFLKQYTVLIQVDTMIWKAMKPN